MAFTHDESVADALSLLETIKEPHPSGALLATFVTEALNPPAAARFLRAGLLAGDAQPLVSTWTYIVESIGGHHNGRSTQPLDRDTNQRIVKRDGGKCCITGKSGSFWDPLVVVPILPIPLGWVTNEALVTEMLGAFFGPNYRDWWLSYAADPDSLSPYCSHWSLRQSAAKAFAQGLIRLDRIQPSMVEYEISHVSLRLHDPIDINGYFALLGDHSRSRTQKVDPRLLGTHARLSQSIQLLQIAQDIKRDSGIIEQHQQGREYQVSFQSPNRFLSYLSSLSSKIMLSVWLLVPSPVRITAYKLLRRIGEALYDQRDGAATMQRLPFGLYLKSLREAETIRNEFAALKLVSQLTSVPVPQPLDVITRKTRSLHNDDDVEPVSYLLESRLPGVPLFRCQYMLSDRDCDRIEGQLADYLVQIRAIPNTVNPKMAICNVLGGQCRDHRIRGGVPVGPFVDEAAFNQVVRLSDDPSRQGHQILFTHADINPRNILVSHGLQADGYFGWAITGIVDWETAGYYPEYWDFTKALFEGFRWTARYNNLVKSAFRRLGQYDGELDVEVQSWESGDGV